MQTSSGTVGPPIDPSANVTCRIAELDWLFRSAAPEPQE